jgi:large subunit ribosomal protein L4
VLEPKTTGKTKDIISFLAKEKIDARRILMVADKKTPELVRATNNIPHVELVSANYLTVYHILNADKILASAAAITSIENWLKEGAK